MVRLSKQHDFRYLGHVQEKTPYSPKFRYQRDPIGNRITSTTTESGSPVIRNYTSNNLNQYTAIDNPTAGPTHDDDGNMLNDGTWTFTWNAKNRMVSAETASTRLEFVYDYQGRRVEKKVYSGSVGSWTLDKHLRFVYDEYLQIEELDALNSNAILKKRVWELGGNRLLSETALSPTPYTVYPLYDANKNITEYIDSTGAIQAHFEYSPFGKITLANGVNPDVFDYRFSSEYFDSETGLVYYNFRYYSPELGRWLSRDPIEEEGGINLYAMCHNDAINWWDWLGTNSASLIGTTCDTVGEELTNTLKTWTNVYWQNLSRGEWYGDRKVGYHETINLIYTTATLFLGGPPAPPSSRGDQFLSFQRWERYADQIGDKITEDVKLVEILICKENISGEACSWQPNTFWMGTEHSIIVKNPTSIELSSIKEKAYYTDYYSKIETSSIYGDQEVNGFKESDYLKDNPEPPIYYNR